MNYIKADKKTIEFIVGELVDGIDEVRGAIADLPIDWDNSKVALRDFLERFLTQEAFEKRVDNEI